MAALVIVLLLLILPAYALSRLAGTIDPWIIASVPLAVSALAYALQRNDKARATAGAWRIPEATLHLCEFLGGWPGSLLAQRQVRHKVAKSSYLIVFWAIVLLHQFLALDSLLGWRWMTQAAAFLRAELG